jgi:UDP-2-acetamido-2-deoxy-ribo-hexuluronate aminotransferase
MINLIGLDRLYDAYSWRLTRRAKKVWQSGLVIGNKSTSGSETEKLETAVAKYTKRKYAVAVGSGTDALYFALKAKGIGPESTVLCPAVSYLATAEAIKRTGATINFVDVDSRGLIGKLPNFGLPHAVVYVNLFGNLAEYATLKGYCVKRRIPLIEDAAQSFGSEYNKVPSGKLGDISALSFSPSKPLPAFGNAGMVLTDSQDEVEVLRGLRYHGYNGVNISYGYNSCIPESISSQLNFLLGKYSKLLKVRKNNNQYYKKNLDTENIEIIETADKTKSNYSKCILKVNGRDELHQYLKTKGIQTAITYKMPMHEMKMFAKDQLSCTNAEALCKKTIAIPNHPFLKKDELKKVCNEINAFYKR